MRHGRACHISCSKLTMCHEASLTLFILCKQLLALILQHIHKFRQHEKLQQAKDQALSNVFDAVVEMSVTGRVAKDLDSIFRRGADWDLGLDHILVLQVQLGMHCILHVAALQGQTLCSLPTTA